jgi:hypothetical protein
MMRRVKRRLWLVSCMLTVVMLLSFGKDGSFAGGDAKLAPVKQPVSDYRLFLQELYSAGALKFFENTEDLLRVARFERALLRYRFLQGQIGRQSGYAPLSAMIEVRLRFLKGQLGLKNFNFPPLRRPRLIRRWRTAKATPSAPPGSAPPKAQASSDSKEGQKSPKGKESTPPAGLSSPEGTPSTPPAPQATTKEPEEEQAEEQKPEKPPPPPRLSRWQRLKKRLLFWRK